MIPSNLEGGERWVGGGGSTIWFHVMGGKQRAREDLEVLGLLFAFSGSRIKAGALSLSILPAASLQLQALGFRLLLEAGVGQSRSPPLQVLLLPLYTAAHLLYILLCTVDGLLYTIIMTVCQTPVLGNNSLLYTRNELYKLLKAAAVHLLLRTVDRFFASCNTASDTSALNFVHQTVPHQSMPLAANTAALVFLDLLCFGNALLYIRQSCQQYQST